MKDALIYGAVAVGVLLIVKSMQPRPAAFQPANPGPAVGGTSPDNGYGAIAAGIGKGLGAMFTGISSMIGASNKGYEED